MIQRLRFLMLSLVLVAALLAPNSPALARPSSANPLQSRVTAGSGLSLNSTGWQPEPVPVMYDPNAQPNRVELLRPAGLAPQSSTFIIDYVAAGSVNGLGDTCLAFPEAAKVAFNDAGAQWGALLNSPVQVRIEACWADMPANVLGHSSALDYRANFSGAPQANTYFPIALANSLAGHDIDPASNCTVASNCDDISITYANGFLSSFYFGTDGKGSGKIDFESVVMHEMGHGLGFAGSLYNSGGYGYQRNSYPFMYDRYGVDNNGVSLLNSSTYPLGGVALGSILTSGNVFLNGPNTRAANGGAPVPLYTPSTWQSGSSYSHLAESYNGTVNAMMTYSIGNNEVLHNPGPVVLGYLQDAGWSIASSSLPAAPSGLTGTAVSPSQINLSWTDNSTNETSFIIQWAGSDLIWGNLGSAPAQSGSGGSVNYNVTGLGEGTLYNFRVCAASLSTCSGFSNTSSATTHPAAPINLLVTGVSANQVNLIWTDISTHETSFIIQRAGSDLNWTQVGTAPAQAGLGGTGSFSNISLTEGTPYNYRVCASNGSPCSDFSNIAGATTRLATPTQVAVSTLYPDHVNLSWNNNSLNASAFIIYRSPDPVSDAAFVQIGISLTSTYTDSTISPDTFYHYRVRASNPAQLIDSDWSVWNDVKTPSKAPTNLSAVGVSTTQILVTWVDQSASETGFKVWRSLDGSTNWVSLPDVVSAPGTGTTVGFTDNSMTEGSHFFYRICVKGTYANSDLVTVQGGAMPAAPTGISASVVAVNHIDVTWTDNSANETGYEIQVSANGSDGWTTIDTLTAGAGATTGPRTYQDLHGYLGKMYYRVRAVTPFAASAWLSGASATPLLPPNLFFVPLLTR